MLGISLLRVPQRLYKAGFAISHHFTYQHLAPRQLQLNLFQDLILNYIFSELYTLVKLLTWYWFQQPDLLSAQWNSSPMLSSSVPSRAVNGDQVWSSFGLCATRIARNKMIVLTLNRSINGPKRALPWLRSPLMQTLVVAWLRSGIWSMQPKMSWQIWRSVQSETSTV